MEHTKCNWLAASELPSMTDGRQEFKRNFCERSNLSKIPLDQPYAVARPSTTLIEPFPSGCNDLAISSLEQSSPHPKSELLPSFHSTLCMEDASEGLTRPKPIRPSLSFQPTPSSSLMLSKHPGFDAPSVIPSCARTSLHNVGDSSSGNNSNNNSNSSIHGNRGMGANTRFAPPPIRSCRVASLLESKSREIDDNIARWKAKKNAFDETGYANAIFLIRNSMDIVRSQYPSDATDQDVEAEEEAFVEIVLDQFTSTPVSIAASPSVLSLQRGSAIQPQHQPQHQHQPHSSFKPTSVTALPSSETLFTFYQKV